MRVLAIIQARMGSTRLPGKVMLPLGGKPVLQHVIERTRRGCNDVVVATTGQPEDGTIAMAAAQCGVACVQWDDGNPNHVFDRFLHTLSQDRFAGYEAVVRVTADCPLLDPLLLLSAIRYYAASGRECGLCVNASDRIGLADGIGCEVVSAAALRCLRPDSLSQAEREHVTLAFYQRGFSSPLKGIPGKYFCDPQRYRLTLDIRRDYERLQSIWADLGPAPDTLAALHWLDKHPEWYGDVF